MVEHETALATNREGWNHVAKYFHGSTALPEYGPLTPTEDTLRLLDEPADACVLELGCGSGHSLRYLADRGARELWGLDLSSTQIAFARETLRPFASRVRLIESPMEVNPGIPENHFDLVFNAATEAVATVVAIAMAMNNKARTARAGECEVFTTDQGHPVLTEIASLGKSRSQ